MKYIDADRLKAEIERRLVRYNPAYTVAGLELNELLSFVTSLQQEQPEVDFFDEIIDVFDANCKLPPRSEEELTMLETISRHFYELGLNAREK